MQHSEPPGRDVQSHAASICCGDGEAGVGDFAFANCFARTGKHFGGVFRFSMRPSTMVGFRFCVLALLASAIAVIVPLLTRGILTDPVGDGDMPVPTVVVASSVAGREKQASDLDSSFCLRVVPVRMMIFPLVLITRC